jgi:hypothetical protein
MGVGASPLCFLQRVPRTVRLLLAWLSIVIGLPLFLTPFPGGGILVAGGCLLLCCASPGLRSGVGKRLARYPRLARRLAPILAVCDDCAKRASP